MSYQESKFRFAIGEKYITFVSSTKVTLSADSQNEIAETWHTLYFSEGSGLPLTLRILESNLPIDYFSEDWEVKKPVLQELLNTYQGNGCQL